MLVGGLAWSTHAAPHMHPTGFSACLGTIGVDEVTIRRSVFAGQTTFLTSAQGLSPARVMGPLVCHEHGTGSFRFQAVC
jgi:hypothetical protein